MLSSPQSVPGLPISLSPLQSTQTQQRPLERTQHPTPTHPILPHHQPPYHRRLTGQPSASHQLLLRVKILLVSRRRGAGPQHLLVRMVCLLKSFLWDNTLALLTEIDNMGLSILLFLCVSRSHSLSLEHPLHPSESLSA